MAMAAIMATAMADMAMRLTDTAVATTATAGK
jgi:hypothetical protein